MAVGPLAVAYQQLHAQVLADLEAQTNLASLFNDLQLTVDGNGNSYWDFSVAETEILNDLSVNRTVGLTTLTDFNQALHAEGLDIGEGYVTFTDDLVTQGTDVTTTFLNGTSKVYGTTGNDVITAWEGNQEVIAGQGGHDTLIGGTDIDSLGTTSGDNEVFYGGAPGDLFIGGVGNNEVFWGGSNNYNAGAAGARDTFIAGQGTESFLESAYRYSCRT